MEVGDYARRCCVHNRGMTVTRRRGRCRALHLLVAKLEQVARLGFDLHTR